MSAREIFDGSDGAATREFYVNLERAGAIGIVAMNLFRAQKCSTRAKKYRGGLRGVGSFRSLAYERKNWSIDNLALTLGKYGPDLGICFGWKQDPGKPLHGEASWVIYVDLPQGQVSFHSPKRFAGPDYPGEWDGRHESEARIIAFADTVFRSGDRAYVGELFVCDGDKQIHVGPGFQDGKDRGE
jgi:hypothetical protein